MRLGLAAFALAGSALSQDAPPALDKAALAPVLDHAWSADGACGSDRVDWVIDTDGWPYARDGGFTQLAEIGLTSGQFRTVDAVGIGSTESIYRLQADGTLRLWSRIYTGEEDLPPEQSVKDGMTFINDEGEKMSPGAATEAMKPCPARTVLYADKVLATFDGKWVDVKGGSCAKGTGTLWFDLKRPVPRVVRGPRGEFPDSTGYAIAFEPHGAAWTVTEGSAFEASMYTFTEGEAGTLTQTTDFDDSKVVWKRCPA